MTAQTLEGGGLTVAGGTLLATEDDRTFRALLVPFREVAQSNLGRFSVPGPGVLTLPPDIRTMTWNDGHNRERPVASTVLLAEQADGVYASMRVADGPDGDAIIAGIRDGSRNRVSVEARDMVIRDGVAQSGHVFGAAIVTPGRSGAFPGATLLAMATETLLADAAADATDPEDPTQAAYSTLEVDPVTGATYETETTVEETEETDPDTGATVITTTTTTIRTETPGDAPAEGSAPVPAQSTAPLLATRRAGATVPATQLLDGRGRRRSSTPAQQAPAETVGLHTLYAMLAAAAPSARGRGWDTNMLARLREPRVVGSLYAQSPETLLAELEDVTFDAAGSPRDMIVPQWIGELWNGRAFQRRWTPLFNSGTLTSDTVKGWRWVEGKTPTVDYYVGNKTDVPSNELDTEPYDVPAQAIAGAHDVDRRYRDFNVTEFWDGYFRGMTESYARKSDAYVPRELFDVTNAATTAIAGGTVPAGVSPVMAKIVDGALAVLDEDLPSFAVVSKADYRDLLLTKEDDKLAYLNSALGLEEGSVENFRVIPAGSDVTAINTGNKVLVGCRSAATVHELAGSPIRIEGLDVARGGIDPGLFGYVALAVHNPKALALVTPHA